MEVSHRNKIIEFLEIKWSNDKNNFLMTDQDKMLLAQLPDDCVIEIYKNFLYKDFLFKFRRLFNLSFKPRKFFGFISKKPDDKLDLVQKQFSKKRLASL